MASGLHKLRAPGGGAAVCVCSWVRGAGSPGLASVRSRFGNNERIRVGGSPGLLPPLNTPDPQGPAVGSFLAGFEFAPPQEPEPRALGTWAATGPPMGPPTPSAHILVSVLR